MKENNKKNLLASNQNESSKMLVSESLLGHNKHWLFFTTGVMLENINYANG